MNSKQVDTGDMDALAAQARERWGATPQWAEYERKGAGRTEGENMELGTQLLALFAPFGSMTAEGADPACSEAQAQVATIQSFITEHYYTCTNEVLAGLGQMYGAGGDFTRNINKAAGPGAAEFAAAAVAAYCAQG